MQPAAHKKLDPIADPMIRIGPDNTPKFELGRIVSTPAFHDHCEQLGVNPLVYIAQHQRGDWGIVDAMDGAQNDTAVNIGGRIFSAYLLPDNKKFWIITESDRKYTTLLFPDEY